MSITVEAIYAARILRPLTPLHEVPEPAHTKVCLTLEALPATESHESVIDVQRQHRIPLAAAVAQEMGDRYEMA